MNFQKITRASVPRVRALHARDRRDVRAVSRVAGSNVVSLVVSLARVTGETLGNFVGKKVLVVGEVKPMDENTATVTMADSKVITVKLASGGSFNSKYVEFEATVDGPTEVTESNRVEFGDDFDQFSYGELCKLINGKAKEMFF